MAVVAEQERPPAVAGTHGWDTAPTIDIADPYMTRAARQARAAWRRTHPDEWRAELEAMSNFDPAFIYDPAHEYDQESTTDPDYDVEGVHFLEYDEDGIVSPLEKRAREVQKRGADTASDILAGTDLEGDYERLIRFRPETIMRANQTSGENHPIGKGVRPDLLVRAVMSASDRERFMPEGVLRLDLGAPVPPLVLEVVSEGSAKRDFHFKKHLYAAAGISEYLVYDLGGKRWTDSPRELLMYRLKGGRYQPVPAPVAGEYQSHVFETSVRIMPAEQEHDEFRHGVPEEDRSPPRFQWWDSNTETWRDYEQDHEQKLVRLGEATNALKFLDTVLPDLPERDRALIEARWLELGTPEDVAERLMAVHETPNAWRSLLPAEESDNQDTQVSDRDTPRRPSGTL